MRGPGGFGVVGGWVVGRRRSVLLIGRVGVVNDDGGGFIPAGDGPDEGGDPANEGPAEEEIEYEDTCRAVAPANESDDGGHEIGNEEQCDEAPGKGKGEYPEE